jgi:predicted nucleotidyltransferase component of viral defense system
MKYASGAAFRRALEDRLRTISLETGVPLVRLRKMVAFDRFLARLFSHEPDQWVVKGGFALQLRLGNSARTTKDIDLLSMSDIQEIYPHLRIAGTMDLGDWFAFEVLDTLLTDTEDIGGLRYPLHALLDGRTFERFHIDVGVGDPLLAPVEHLETPALLAFAGIAPTVVPCYPITQQIAEKYHAYTRPHASGGSSRVKDFVDMLLLAGMGELESENLQQAIQATFDDRRTHELPLNVPLPSQAWVRPFHKLADEVGLEFESLSDAGEALQQFLELPLRIETSIVWNPANWHWE